MSYKGLDVARNAESPHLGGNVKAGDPYTYCPTVWDYIISRFCVNSVLDLGSGSGNASHYFYQKGLKVVAIEGFQENVEKSLYPAIMHDLTTSPVRTVVDFVHCQEVVEHIEEEHLDNLLESLLCGKYILITHAVPGQLGHHHVNLQNSEYWVDHLAEKGCTLLEEDTDRIRKFAADDRAIYVAKSGMIFANNHRF
jgi:2-polyprenyl-3-methyl-5-hydroxy-6-metoxy-1,4-benzoquinol methylase